MKLETLRPFAAALVAIGFALGFTATPASAQYAPTAPDAAAETPEKPQWYMPQPWVHPPQTGPQIRKLPGYYGHVYRNRSYGGFSNYCYGDCGYRAPGTVSTGGGVILERPTVATYDEDEYMIVPRTLSAPPQPVVERRAPITPTVVPANQPRGYKPEPTVTTQNGVRVIHLTPLTNKSY